MGNHTGLSDQLSAARLMVNGLKTNAEIVAKVGITEERTTAFEKVMNEAIVLDNEQENLKAALKNKTAELDAKQKEMTALLNEFRRLVKVAAGKNDWVSFGISDKR